MNTTVTVSWIEWCEGLDKDNYLDPSERVRIYIILGTNDFIAWGDTITLGIHSGSDLVNVGVRLIVGLPAEMSIQGNSIQGEYSKCHTYFTDI